MQLFGAALSLRQIPWVSISSASDSDKTVRNVSGDAQNRALSALLSF